MLHFVSHDKILVSTLFTSNALRLQCNALLPFEWNNASLLRDGSWGIISYSWRNSDINYDLVDESIRPGIPMCFYDTKYR